MSQSSTTSSSCRSSKRNRRRRVASDRHSIHPSKCCVRCALASTIAPSGSADGFFPVYHRLSRQTVYNLIPDSLTEPASLLRRYNIGGSVRSWAACMSNLHVKYLLAGGGVASSSAATAIREIDPEGAVLLVGQEV